MAHSMPRGGSMMSHDIRGRLVDTQSLPGGSGEYHMKIGFKV